MYGSLRTNLRSQLSHSIMGFERQCYTFLLISGWILDALEMCVYTRVPIEIRKVRKDNEVRVQWHGMFVV